MSLFDEQDAYNIVNPKSFFDDNSTKMTTEDQEEDDAIKTYSVDIFFKNGQSVRFNGVVSMDFDDDIDEDSFNILKLLKVVDKKSSDEFDSSEEANEYYMKVTIGEFNLDQIAGWSVVQEDL